MNFFSEGFEDKLAYLKAGKGEGTGPTSRILSNINILIVVYLLVILIKAHFYLPAILLLGLGFTRFSLLSFIGFIIYFVFIQYWEGVIAMSISGVVGWISAWTGMNNIKRNFHNNKAKVDPLEGMSDLLVVLIFQTIFFVLALITSGLLSISFWVLFTIVTLFEIARYYHYLASPWRRLYYPLMVRYAFFIGLQMSIAEKLKREVNITTALIDFMRSIYPNWTEEEVEKFLENVRIKMLKFTDRKGLIDAFKKNNPSLNLGRISKELDKFHKALKRENPRWVIAEIVERDYGIDERIKYLQSIITGRAR